MKLGIFTTALPELVRHEFERWAAIIRATWRVEHDDEGHHLAPVLTTPPGAPGEVLVSTGESWVALPPAAHAPLAHHATHEPGGADAIAVLSAAVLTSGILPDARLSANVQLKPLALSDLPAHHTLHETGGSDAIAALHATVITAGKLNDARLSTNVPLKNTANTFTAQNDFNGVVTVYTSLTVRNFLGLYGSGFPQVNFLITDAPVDGRNWQWYGDPSNGQLYFRAINDAGDTPQGTPLALARNGAVAIGQGIFERGRIFPLGEWVAWTPTFWASGGAWTVEAGDLVNARYTLIGKTAHVVISIDNSTLAVDSILLYLSLPFVPARQHRNTCQTNDTAGYAVGIAYVLPGNTALSIGKLNFSAFLATTNGLHLHFSLTFEIQ